jgi:hypothetical protein
MPGLPIGQGVRSGQGQGSGNFLRSWSGTYGRPDIRTYRTTFLGLCQPERSGHRMFPDPNAGLPKKAITSVNESQPSQKSLTLIRVFFLLTFADRSYCLFWETAICVRGARGIGPIRLTQPEKNGPVGPDARLPIG